MTKLFRLLALVAVSGLASTAPTYAQNPLQESAIKREATVQKTATSVAEEYSGKNVAPQPDTASEDAIRAKQHRALETGFQTAIDAYAADANPLIASEATTMGVRDFLTTLNGQLRAKKSPFSIVKANSRFKGKEALGFDVIDINTGAVADHIDMIIGSDVLQSCADAIRKTATKDATFGDTKEKDELAKKLRALLKDQGSAALYNVLARVQGVTCAADKRGYEIKPMVFVGPNASKDWSERMSGFCIVPWGGADSNQYSDVIWLR
ncbi:MAG: hypothetical protein K2X93_25370 [Candidatus Obscuribacterales bacterium]|nr:hypothetical protein [Candidatus Obscuribacterales bacterium]